MIDPINSVPLSRLLSPVEIPASRNKKDAPKVSAETAAPEVKWLTPKDTATFVFDLNGDLGALQAAYKTLYQRTREQLEKYFGVPKANAGNENNTHTTQGTQNQDQTIPSGFLPPDNASAQDLLDFYSPKNTASRIVDFATGFFKAYQSNHEKSSKEEKVNGFSTLAADAVKQGFADAEKILGSFDKLGEVGKNIKQTYEIVLQEIDAFRRKNLNGQGLEKSPSDQEIIHSQTDTPPQVEALV